MFKNKLIIFTLKAVPTNVYVELVAIEDIIPEETGYTLIPGPEINIYEGKEDFERKLADTERAFRLPKYPDFFESPELIYLDNTLYRTTLTNGQSPTHYSQKSDTPVTAIDTDEKFIGTTVEARVGKHIYFIENQKMNELRNEMDDKEINLNDKVSKRKESVKETDTSVEVKDLNLPQETTKAIESSKEEELYFIHRLKANARKRSLFYEDIDLYSFHISCKTNLITVIGGMAGTGKSQMAQLYGETLGLREKQQFIMIPISPSYHEPNDVLGYLNPTTGVYHESETGLVSLLLDAEKYPEELFMCVFDEMNMAQVEHWFSPFISLLEADKNKRNLTLFNENSYCVNKPYKPKIKIGDNVVFVGTANFDETTKDFSDRLLDRTNIITPTKKTFKESLKIARSTPDSVSQKGLNQISTKMYRKDWISPNDGLMKLLDHEVDVLDTLHQKINENDSQKGVSFRVALAIGTFLDNIPVTKDGQEMILRKDAFDLQIKQRILTKIQGLESFAGPLVGTASEQGILSKYFKDLELLDEKHSFKQSLKILESKKKELMDNGFTH